MTDVESQSEYRRPEVALSLQEEVTGEALFELFFDVLSMRRPEIEQVLRKTQTGETKASEGIAPHLISHVLQAQSFWFQLLSLAEQYEAMRIQRQTEEERGDDRSDLTVAHAVAKWHESGVSTDRIRTLLSTLLISPVITAHPTEAKRVTVLGKHRALYRRLLELDSPRWTQREREELITGLKNEIDLLWMTGELRLERPTVAQEIAWGLHFFNETLFDGVPSLLKRFEHALNRYYPNEKFDIPPFFQFGLWIGGDRDGNPFVTNEVTRQAVHENCLASLRRYEHRLGQLVQMLSITEREVTVSAAFREALNKALIATGDAESIAERNPGEIFRQYLVCVIRKLEATIRRLLPGMAETDTLSYAKPEEFINELRTVERGLIDAQCGSIATAIVAPLRREVEAFRFSTARLDLRENSDRLNMALVELAQLSAKNEGSVAPTPEEPDSWRGWITNELAKPRVSGETHAALPPEAAETLGMFQLVSELREQVDQQAFGCFIISNTHQLSDVLGTYLLAKEAGLFADTAGVEICTLPIVPIFESMEDLQRAPEIIRELLAVPVVRRSVRAQGEVQEVMIGYSDSNKDGGFLSSNWELHKAQAQLSRIGAKAGIEVSFFHGRGGSVSRGGAPTNRAIAAQPTGSIGSQFRLTEQGEVVSYKYANRGTANYQIELLAASVLEHSIVREAAEPHYEFDEAMEALSGPAYVTYRRLLGHPDFIEYYTASSPLEELALLNVGSRPARRSGTQSLDDLRAIPWVFAWTQNRHFIPSWYGVGTSLSTFLEIRGERGATLLRRMFEESQLFRLVIDEVEKTLVQVDLTIAGAYAELVSNEQVRAAVFGMIKAEHAKTVESVLRVSDGNMIAERFPQFRQRMERRLPMLERAHREQIELLHHVRAMSGGEEQRNAHLTPLLLSINCIAAGFGTVG